MADSSGSGVQHFVDIDLLPLFPPWARRFDTTPRALHGFRVGPIDFDVSGQLGGVAGGAFGVLMVVLGVIPAAAVTLRMRVFLAPAAAPNLFALEPLGASPAVSAEVVAPASRTLPLTLFSTSPVFLDRAELGWLRAGGVRLGVVFGDVASFASSAPGGGEFLLARLQLFWLEVTGSR